MNILTKIRLLNELNEKEIRLGIVGTSASWHEQYKDSAWIYAGGLPYELSEGDIICVFSQYGEVVNINLVRDKKTGKSKGFAFVCFQDQRSTILSVDNLNGTKIKGRQIRVDHVMNYKVPKDDDDIDDITRNIREEGVAPRLVPIRNVSPEMPRIKREKRESTGSESDSPQRVKKKKRKKEVKELKFLKKKGKSEKESSSEKHRRDHKHKNQKRSSRSPDKRDIARKRDR